LYAETRDGAQAMLDALADFCNYSGMVVNTKKCVSVCITWSGDMREDFYCPFVMQKSRCQMDAQGTPIPEEMNMVCTMEEIPVQEVSIYLGLPIGFSKE
jgi:hypothetical protein